ncbi:recombinase family protein [Methylobacterium sp. BTF04]|uniref:recombinase family protein n=1 Tax=Methylobacterium sp. BTF04 TaxID=2708300 RepID=UPI0013D2395F|nr:recombinase family protein [Methylobacterium sp. BTF04]NEU12476.1 recombinase family protein [Methylobacterium sp. BTF04]
MALAYSYIRMSRPEQMRGDSLRRQVDAANAWAKARGVLIDESIRDNGVSAYRGKNHTEGALGAFLKLVTDGVVKPGSFLVVESLDRLSRETVLDALPRFISIIKAGIVIVTLVDKQEYDQNRLRTDWTPLIVSLMVMARAHEESKTKAMRLREAWSAKRATAAEKVVTSRVPEWLFVREGRIHRNPERVELVQRIFRETIDGDGRRKIIRRLNDEKVPAFRNGKEGWQPSYVAKLLASRAVIGEFQAFRRGDDGVRHAEGDPVPGYYPSIIDEFEFLKAGQASRSRAAAPGARGQHVTNLFTGLAKCAGCGGSMVVENKGKPPKGARYLVCAGARRSVGCDNRRLWRIERIEREILSQLRRVALPAAAGSAPAPSDEVAILEGRLATAVTRRERLFDLVEGGDEGAVARVKALSATIGELREAISWPRPTRCWRLRCRPIPSNSPSSATSRRGSKPRPART